MGKPPVSKPPKTATPSTKKPVGGPPPPTMGGGSRPGFGSWLAQNSGGSVNSAPQWRTPKLGDTFNNPEATPPILGALGWLADMASRPLFGVTNMINDQMERSVDATKADVQGDHARAFGIRAVGDETVKQFDRGDWAGGIGSSVANSTPLGAFFAGLVNTGNNPEYKKYGHELIEHGTDMAGSLDPNYVDEKDNVNEFVKGGFGFVLDVGLDPLTWVPGVGWLAKGVGAGARGVTKGLEAGSTLFKAGEAVSKGAAATEKFSSRWLDMIPTGTGKAMLEADKALLATRLAAIGNHPEAVSAWLKESGKAGKVPEWAKDPTLSVAGLTEKELAKGKKALLKVVSKPKSLKAIETQIGDSLATPEQMLAKGAKAADDMVGGTVPLAEAAAQAITREFSGAISALPKATSRKAWEQQYVVWNRHIDELLSREFINHTEAGALRATLKSGGATSPERAAEVAAKVAEQLAELQTAHMSRATAAAAVRPAGEAGAAVVHATPGEGVSFLDTLKSPMTAKQAKKAAAKARVTEAAVRESGNTDVRFSKGFVKSLNDEVANLGKASEFVSGGATKADKIADVIPALERALKSGDDLRTPKARSSAVVSAGKLDKEALSQIDVAKAHLEDFSELLERRLAEAAGADPALVDPAMAAQRKAYEAKVIEENTIKLVLELARDGVIREEAQAALFSASGILEVAKKDMTEVSNLTNSVKNAQEGILKSEREFTTRDGSYYSPQTEGYLTPIDPPVYEFTTLPPRVQSAIAEAEAAARESIVKRLEGKGIRDAETVAEVVERELPSEFNRSQALIDAIVSEAKLSDLLVDALGADIVKVLRSTKTSATEFREVIDSLRTVVFSATGAKPKEVEQSIRVLYKGKDSEYGLHDMADARTIGRDQVNLKFDPMIKEAKAAGNAKKVSALQKSKASALKEVQSASYETRSVSSMMEIGSLNSGKDDLVSEFTGLADSFIGPETMKDWKTHKALIKNAERAAKETFLLRNVYDVAKLMGPAGEPTILAKVLSSLGVDPATKIVQGKQLSSFVSRIGKKVPEDLRKGTSPARAKQICDDLAKSSIPKGGQKQVSGANLATVDSGLIAGAPDAAIAAARAVHLYSTVLLFPEKYKPARIVKGSPEVAKRTGDKAVYHAQNQTIVVNAHHRPPEEVAFFVAHEMGHHLEHTLQLRHAIASGDVDAAAIVTALRGAAPKVYEGLGDNEVLADAIQYFVSMQSGDGILQDGIRLVRAYGDSASDRSAAFRLSEDALAEVHNAVSNYLSIRGVLKQPRDAMGNLPSAAPELQYDALESALVSLGAALSSTKNLKVNDASFLQTALLFGNYKAAVNGVTPKAGILGRGYSSIAATKLKGSEAATELARRVMAALEVSDGLMQQAGKPLLFMSPTGNRVAMSYSKVLQILGTDPQGAQVVLRSMFNRGGAKLVADEQGYSLTQVAWTKVADAVADLIERNGVATVEETVAILKETTQTIKGEVKELVNGLAGGGMGRYLNPALGKGKEWETVYADEMAVALAEAIHRNKAELIAASQELAEKTVKLGVEESGDMQRKVINDILQKMYQIEKAADGSQVIDSNGLFKILKTADEAEDPVLAPGWRESATEALAAARAKVRSLAEDGAAMDVSEADALKRLEEAFGPKVLDAAGHRMETFRAQQKAKSVEEGQVDGRSSAQKRSDAEARTVIDDEEVFNFKSTARDRADVPKEVQTRMAGLLEGPRLAFKSKYLMEDVFDLGQSHTALTGLWNAPRNALLSRIAKAGGIAPGTTTKTIDVAFSALQQGTRHSGNAEADALIPLIEEYMEPLFHMVQTSDKAAGNVLFQNNIDINLLNKALRKTFNKSTKFEFDLDMANSNAVSQLQKLKAAGRKVANEEEWLQRMRIRHISNQWRKWEVTDSLGFLRRFDEAVTGVYGQMALGHSLRARSIRLGFESATPKPEYARIGNYQNNAVFSVLDPKMYYKKEYLYEIENLDRFLNAARSPDGALGDFLRDYYSPIQNMWKELVTIRRPGHHIRNEVGDLTLTWGIEGNRYLGTSLKDAFGLMAIRNDYEGVDIIQAWSHLDGIDFSRASRAEVRETAAIAAGSKEAPKATKVFSNGRFGAFTGGQIRDAAQSFGLLRVARDIEDIYTAGSKGAVQKTANFLLARDTKFDKFFKTISEVREHHMRLAHFMQIIHKVQKDGYIHLGYKGKYKPKDANDLFRVAAEKVKKYHPDSSMMTLFELRYMRTIIPFYSWFRSAIPAVIESAIVHPGRALVFPKASYNLGVAMGVDPDSLANPFPADQEFPSFLRENILGPQFKIGDSYININPGISSVDIGNMLFNPEPVREIAGMISPLIRTPAEMLSGGSWSTGGRINDMSDYLDSAIPMVGPLANFTGYSPTGTVVGTLNGQGADQQYGVRKGNKTELDAGLSFANFMLGMNLQNQSRPNYTKYAQFEEKKKWKPGDAPQY